MAEGTTDLDILRSKIVEQGERVDALKASNASKEELDESIGELRDLKEKLRQAIEELRGADFDESKRNQELRSNLDSVLLQRFFVVPSFEIYGGIAGLFDLGPPGCGLRDNIISFWKRHFILEESMLEIATVSLTPESVLKTSGHVDRFTDYMVKETKTGECFRADKLLEEHIETLLEDISIPDSERKKHLAIHSRADDFSREELSQMLKQYSVLSPTGGEIGEPYPFNLMFETQIGPSGKFRGFMRPETAQGIFTNFKRLLECNGSKIPFAAAQIGTAYRNEISPRAGLLRVREFVLAEIEHFVHPQDKSHPKFELVGDEVMNLLPQAGQGKGEDQMVLKTIKVALEEGMVGNETLAYFMARTQQFLLKVGIKKELLRFRQHKANEMAHYASDCWDAEIKTSYGWIECVGHADRSCFDLERHAAVSKTDLSAHIVYDEPKMVETIKADINKGKIGPKYRKEAGKVLAALNGVGKAEAMEIQRQLDSEGKAIVRSAEGEFEIDSSMVKYEIVTEKKSGEKFIPAVIEPSFGIGRILYAVLEHAFYTRDGDEQRRVFGLKPSMAPTKVSILPLSNHADFKSYVDTVSRELTKRGIAVNVDNSSAFIGRRYARADEIGIPFGVTIDFDTVQSQSVTIRERDSLTQIRVSLDELYEVISRLVNETLSWEEAYEVYPKFFTQETTTS